MRVAHFATFGPNQCGLYHTAKELVLAERLLGIDARFIDPEKGVCRDGSFTTEDWKWAYKADVLVRHTFIPARLQNSGIPVVMCLHGRPDSSYMGEFNDNPVLVGIANKATDCRYKAFVTFWEEYQPFWANLVPNVHYVPATVDLEEFPETPHTDEPIILVSDVWRDDIRPLYVLEAAVRFARKHNGKIHVAAIPENKSVKTILRGCKDVLGELYGLTSDIKQLYAKSNILVTPHVIATRAIREAMASGLKVVAGAGCKYTPWSANALDIDGFSAEIEKAWKGTYNSRRCAEREFGMKKAGRAMKKILDEVAKVEITQRKVFVDVGAHLGETVRRFYREVPDAREYEIYCFEPDMKTFEKLDENVGHIDNVHLINAAAYTDGGMTTFFPGRANDNEGGTSLAGKLTGAVDYGRPAMVECVDFSRWLKANKGDYTIVKMNIEGGEYDLMEKLLDDDMADSIDRLYVQLHAHKFEHGPMRQRFQRIESRFWNEAKCDKFFSNKGFHPF
ncbi:MAG: FkbM family methyltransferase [Chloroflexi bacterium]|nr:FkbM family methyltransferase [Chloroflexota bacterium]